MLFQDGIAIGCRGDTGLGLKDLAEIRQRTEAGLQRHILSVTAIDGINVVNGSVLDLELHASAVRRQVLEEILPFTDTFLYDIKSMDSQVHQRCTGRNNGNILENLRFLCASGARVEIRYPFVPGYNDQCHEIGAFLEGLPGIWSAGG